MRGKAFWLAVGVVVTLAYARIYFGIDVGDEAFYVALPYRFAIGDKPYVDEWNLCQGTALLLTPVVALYMKVRGSSDGIILFLRHLYFLMTCGIALAIYRRYRNVGIALIPLCFVPLGIPNLSYNTVGAGAFLLGLIFVRRSWLAGVLHGIASLAYPPMGAAAVLFAPWHAWLAHDERRARRFFLYAAGGAAAVAFLLAAYGVGPSDLWVLRERMKTSADPHRGYGFSKVFEIALALALYVLKPGSWLALGGLIAGFLAERKGRPFVAASCALAGLLGLAFFSRASWGGLGAHGFLLALAALAPVLVWRLGTEARPPFLTVWVPSLVLAIVMGWTSTNGILNCGVGFTGGAIVAVLLLDRWIGALDRRAPAVMHVVVLGALLYFNRTVFRDGNVTDLTARMSRGPFQGLLTHPEKRVFFDEMVDDIEGAARGAGTIVIYPQFPAGYLVTRRRPATPSVWDPCFSAALQGCDDYYRKRDRNGLIAVKIKRLMYQETRVIRTEADSEAIDGWVRETCRKTLEKPNYEVYDCSLPPG